MAAVENKPSLWRSIKQFWKGLWSSGSSAHRDLSALMSHGHAGGLFTSQWTDSRAELVRHFRHWTYIAIDRIGTKVATQVPNVTLIKAPGEKTRRKLLDPYRRSKALTPLLSHEQLEPVKEDHPLLRLLRDPNEPDTAYDLWYETILFLYLTGNAYWWIPCNKTTGLPDAIWVIPSHWVHAVQGRGGKLIDHYVVMPLEGHYHRHEIPYEDILHFKRKSPISKVDGYSPQTAINHWLDTQESVDRSRMFSFRNGTFPTVSIEMSGEVEDITKEKLDQIEEKFAARYAGEMQANKPLITPPGMKVRSLMVTPPEMGFVESAEQLRDNILAAFGVPACVAQINQNMTYGSVVAAQVGFTSFTVNPLCRFLGQYITEKLAWRYDEKLRVWWEDCTPDDPEMLEKRIITDLQCGAITPNEVRSLRGREPYPLGGDDPLSPVNLHTLPFVTGKKVDPLQSQEDHMSSSNSGKPHKEPDGDEPSEPDGDE